MTPTSDARGAETVATTCGCRRGGELPVGQVEAARRRARRAAGRWRRSGSPSMRPTTGCSAPARARSGAGTRRRRRPSRRAAGEVAAVPPRPAGGVRAAPQVRLAAADAVQDELALADAHGPRRPHVGCGERQDVRATPARLEQRVHGLARRPGGSQRRSQEQSRPRRPCRRSRSSRGADAQAERIRRAVQRGDRQRLLVGDAQAVAVHRHEPQRARRRVLVGGASSV